MLLRLDVFNRYIKGCLYSVTVQQVYKRTTGLFLQFAPSRKEYTDGFLCAFLFCSGGNYPLTAFAGSMMALRSKIIKRAFRGERARERDGRGDLYTCASLTLDKEIFQPTRATEKRSQKHRSVATWRGDWESEGGVGGREDERELGGETES